MNERDLFGEGLPEHPKPQLPIADLSTADFVPDEDGVPRIDDWRLAEILGFVYVPELHRSSSRHRDYLMQLGNLWNLSINSTTRGRPGTRERYNFEQAQYLTVTSRGRGWQAVLVHLVKIHSMWIRGEFVARDAAAEAKAESSMAKATEAAPEVMRAFKEWRRQNPTGLDLLCTGTIVDEQDQPIRGVCEIHHMKGIYRNSIEDGLPVPVWFHRKLTADRTENGPEWQQARNAHRAFLDKYRANKPRGIFDA